MQLELAVLCFIIMVIMIVGLLVFGFAGTYIGKLALNRLPESVFQMGLKTVLTIISAHLLYEAIIV